MVQLYFSRLFLFLTVIVSFVGAFSKQLDGITPILDADVVVSKSGNDSFNSKYSPCNKEGLVGDPFDPTVYYLCVRHKKGYRIQETFICSKDEVFNPTVSKCTTPSGNSSDYECLKKNLENDASLQCFDETIKSLEEELDVFIDAAAYRGDPKRNFHLSVKDIHLNMRQNYATLIQSTGQNIFPLIVATDNDTPDLAGVGGVYKVYFRNGTMKRIVPVSSEFELHKCLSHMVLGVFAIIAPYFRAPNSINWQPALNTLKQRIAEALFALPSGGLPPKEEVHAKKMLQMADNFIQTCIKENSVTHEKFHEFSNKMAPYIDKSMQIAAKAHVTASIPAIQQLKNDMGEAEWRKVYVVIPTVWPVSLYNIRLQVFRKVMDFKQIKQQVLITEGARSEDDARTTLGRIVADRALAQLVFGGLDNKNMRDHLFSLSTRRDLLSTTEEDAVDKWCGGDDNWEILTSTSAQSRCPMTKHMATMLRQSP